MLEVAKLSMKDRSDLITYTAVELGINEAIVEKDFWVCFMLDILFHDFDYSDVISFKGGTSLSKGYNLIERFSEDIDIILDWRVLGYRMMEPWEERSGGAQDRFGIEVSKRTGEFLRGKFMPSLKMKIKDIGVEDFKLYMNEDENELILFEYPRLFKDNALVEEIRLEIGSLAAWTPLTTRTITSMAAEVMPQLFSRPSTEVRTVDAKRTFWEKATILHDVAHRTTLPARYSRHYYDLYQLSLSDVKQEAFNDVNLLKKVADFKSKFYRSNRARYDQATPDEILLIPSRNIIEQMEKDYEAMKSMIYGEIIPYETILEGLDNLLLEIRELNT